MRFLNRLAGGNTSLGTRTPRPDHHHTLGSMFDA
jgi:hypothetical protein